MKFLQLMIQLLLRKKSVVIRDLCISALVSDGRRSLMLGAQYGAWHVFDESRDMQDANLALKENINRAKTWAQYLEHQKVVNRVFNGDGKVIAVLSEKTAHKKIISYIRVCNANNHENLWERDFQGHLNQLFFPLSSSTDKVVVLGENLLVEMNSSNHEKLQLAAVFQSCSSIVYNPQDQSFIFPGMNVEAGSRPGLQLLKYDVKGQPSNIKELLITGDAESMQCLFRFTDGNGLEWFIYGTKNSLEKEGYLWMGRQQDLRSSIQENLCSIS